MALLDHIHVVGVAGEGAVEEERLTRPLLLLASLVPGDRGVGGFVSGGELGLLR